MTHTIVEWVKILKEEYGIDQTYGAIYQRSCKSDDPEYILFAPKKDGRKWEYEGKLYNIKELAKLNGTIRPKGMELRLNGGWSVKEAVETPTQRKHKPLKCGEDCFNCKYEDCIA